MNNQIVNLIRIGVAAAVAAVCGFLAVHFGLPALSADTQAVIVTAILAVIAPLYTAIVHWLEARAPWLGHLLLVRPKKGPGTAGSHASVSRRTSQVRVR